MPTNNTAENDNVLDLFSDAQMDYLGRMMRIYDILEKRGLPKGGLDEILGHLYEMFARYDLEYYCGNMMAEHLGPMMRPAAFEALCESIANDADHMVNEDLAVMGCDVDGFEDDEDDECADDDDSDDDAPQGHLA